MSGRRALLLGGTGHLGSAVLAQLAARGVSGVFTFHSQTERAESLAEQHGFRAVPVDLRDAAALSSLFASLEQEEFVPDLFIHCAAISRLLPLAEISLALWQQTVAVNAQSAFLACQWLGDRMHKGGSIVLVGALDRTQSLPLPVHFAATQGMLSAMVMALGHELGPRGILINLVSLGMLDGGIATQLDERRRTDYQHFSALRRVGEAREAAQVICWLALENHYINGKTLAANGGI